MMKYFTMDGWLDDQRLEADPSEASRAVQAYDEYLRSIKNDLPPEFVQLLRTVCLNDGRLREMTIDVAAQRATLRWDASDLTMRHRRDVMLTYGGIVYF